MKKNEVIKRGCKQISANAYLKRRSTSLKFSPAVGEKLIELLESGYSVPAAAKELRIEARTINYWLNPSTTIIYIDVEWRKMLVAAHECGAYIRLSHINDIAADETIPANSRHCQCNYLLKTLQHEFPNIFGSRLRLEGEVNVVPTVRVAIPRPEKTAASLPFVAGEDVHEPGNKA